MLQTQPAAMQTWVSLPSHRGRAGVVQPGERGHHVPGLPTPRPHRRSPDQAAIALLTVSLQGAGAEAVGLGRDGGAYLSRVQAPVAIKAALFMVRNGE